MLVPAQRRLLLLAAGAFVCVFALRLWLEAIGPLPGERWAYAELPPWQHRIGVVAEITIFFDLLGRPLFAAVALFTAVWFLVRAGRPRDAVLVVVASAGVAVNMVLKALSGVTPLWAEIHPGLPGLNYPSGHTVHAVVFAGALAVLAHRRGRLDLVVCALVPIVITGPSRLVGGAHLISDVIAGYLVGLAWLALAVVAAPAVSASVWRARRAASAG